MNELALFAGAGGGLLGTKLLGWRCVCAVEWEPYCIEVLCRRQEEGHLEAFPIWDDVRTFDGKPWRGKVDIITAGFPCQPFSVAGKGLAEDDERNGWPDTIRIIREVQPRFCLLENVPGLLAHQYFGTILGDLAESGYDVRWRVLSAAEVGAPHRRDRLWIVADNTSLGWCSRWTESERKQTRLGSFGSCSVAHSSGHRRDGRTVPVQPGRQEQSDAYIDGASQGPSVRWWLTDPADVAGAAGAGWGQQRSTGEALPQPEKVKRPAGCGGGVPNTNGEQMGRVAKSREECGERPTQPRLGRVAHGVANRVDRLRAIGNGQVPAVVRAAWEMMGDGV